MVFGFDFASGLSFGFAINIILFLAGFFCLIKGGDMFVDGAVSIARRFRLPEVIIGATIVSIGTTLPEVMVSAGAAVGGSGAMAYGNAIGSIICNTSLIAAITITAAPSVVERKTVTAPVIFFFSSAAFFLALALTGSFPRWAGFVLLGIFVVYIVYSSVHGLKNKEAAPEDDENEKNLSTVKSVVFLIVEAALIALEANLLVDNGKIITRTAGVPESVIALTFVALGTSLPELITAIVSIKKGHGLLSLGNIIGANLFNIVLVTGISVSLAPFPVPAEKTLAGMNASLIVDMPVMFAVMSILCVPALIRGKLSRAQGIILLCIYAGFIVFQFAF